MKKQLLFCVAMLYAAFLYSQSNVAINTDGTAPHPSAMLDVKNPNKGFLAPRVALAAVTDVATIASPATGLLVYNTNVTITNGSGAGYYYFNGTSWSSLVSGAHYIGEPYLGGIVFWVNPSGQHGLVASTADQSPATAWNNSVFKICNTGDGIGSGGMNTSVIVALQTPDNPSGDFAAKYCVRYTSTFNTQTIGGWFLPSKYELNLLFAQRSFVGGFASSFYWSSTDGVSGADAYAQNFGTGIQINDFKNTAYHVRAIREF
jgi:hypothetical protein